MLSESTRERRLEPGDKHRFMATFHSLSRALHLSCSFQLPKRVTLPLTPCGGFRTPFHQLNGKKLKFLPRLLSMQTASVQPFLVNGTKPVCNQFTTAASPVVCISPFLIHDLNHYLHKVTVSGQSCELLSKPLSNSVSKQSV